MKQKGSGENTVVCARAFFISKNYFGILSRTISRVMSWLRKSAAGIIIYLGRLSPAASSDQPEAGGPRHRFCSVLLRMGFTEPPLLPGERWSLTPPFHPYRPKPAVSFCCTFLGVASTGRYPASCPVKPGLSSSAAFRHMQPRLPVLLRSVPLRGTVFIII